MKDTTQLLCVVGALEQRMKGSMSGKVERRRYAETVRDVRSMGLQRLCAVIRMRNAEQVVCELGN